MHFLESIPSSPKCPDYCLQENITQRSIEEIDSLVDKKASRYASCESLQALAHVLKCPTCDSSLSAEEDIATQRGLVSRIAFRCAVRMCMGGSTILSDSYDSQQTRLNIRYFLAARMIRKGRTSLDTFNVIMNLPPSVVDKSYEEASQGYHDVVLESSISAAKELHAQSATAKLCVAPPVVENDDD